MSVMLALADIYYYQGRYDEAETTQLLAIESLREHVGEDDEYFLVARWDLATIWFKQGKGDESEALALEVAALIMESRGPQHKIYIHMVEALRDPWGVHPDGTATRDLETVEDHKSDDSEKPEESVNTNEFIT